VTDLYVFRNPKSEKNDLEDYLMYVLSEQGILFFPGVQCNTKPVISLNTPG
jgi:hypothetical protein